MFRSRLYLLMGVSLGLVGCKTGGGDDPATTLWKTSGQTYTQWHKVSEAPEEASRPHGAFAQIFYNDVAKAAVGGEGPWPDGSIVVKNDHHETDGAAGEIRQIMFMKKEQGEWFWGKYTPQGKVQASGVGIKMCTDCHSKREDRDMVATELL